MNKKMIIGVTLAAVGVIGLFGISSSEQKTELIAGSAALICAGAAVFLIGLNKGRFKAPPSADSDPATGSELLTAYEHFDISEDVDGSSEVDYLPLHQGEYFRIYKYRETLCVIKDQEDPLPYIRSVITKDYNSRQILFEFEPENEYDDQAVAVTLGGKKIGYVYRGQTQDMIHSYYERSFEVSAHINTFTDEKITYNIGFYKPKEKCRINKLPFKRAGLIESHLEGDILEVGYDAFDECFKVYDSDHEYKLPASVEKYANKYYSVPAELGENCESLIFYK